MINLNGLGDFIEDDQNKNLQKSIDASFSNSYSHKHDLIKSVKDCSTNKADREDHTLMETHYGFQRHK